MFMLCFIFLCGSKKTHALTYTFLYLHTVAILWFGAAELQWKRLNVVQRLFCGATDGGRSIAHFTFCFLGFTTDHHVRVGIHGYNHLSAL